MNNKISSQEVLLSLDTITGKHKHAIARFGKILDLKDSVFARKYRNNLKASELRYQNQKKDNQIALQQLKIEKAKKQKRTFLYLFLFSLLSGLLLLVVLRKYQKSSS